MARITSRDVQAKVTTNAPSLVKQAIKARGYTQAMLAEQIGYNGQNSIAMALNGRNMQINVLAMMLDALGFDLIIKDRNSSNKDNVWKIELINKDGGDQE